MFHYVPLIQARTQLIDHLNEQALKIRSGQQIYLFDPEKGWKPEVERFPSKNQSDELLYGAGGKYLPTTTENGRVRGWEAGMVISVAAPATPTG